MSQLVADLERAGLLERSTVSDDRRRRGLTLSGHGEEVLASASLFLRERLGALLAELPPPEADALVRLLGRVEEALGGTPPPRRPPRPEARPRRPR